MSKVLITGVAGFIGSSLARAFVEAGHDVCGIDNLSTGRIGNISAILSSMEFVAGDVRDGDLLRRLCEGRDVVFHEAALPSVPKSVIDPRSSHVANVCGTLEVLIAARDAGVRRVVYAASSSAYGESETLPKHEQMATAPMSPYAVQKLAGEHYMQAFSRVYGIETVSLRYFNVFGPYQAADSPYSGVLAKFITKMLEGQAPTIFGDGGQSRDFTYIDNVVQANVLAAFAPAEKISGNVYNVACGERISLLETYRILAEMLRINQGPVFAPPRTGDIRHSLADISRAKQDLGYDPKVSFIEGLRRTVNWYAEGEFNLHPAPVSHSSEQLVA
ncbi:MAG TPA: SDR family oxidoreductase [Acidobacteriaceae bacterium]|nr:SDR family oxidoreductase [Acidobacteriaceae bacterium]